MLDIQDKEKRISTSRVLGTIAAKIIGFVLIFEFKFFKLISRKPFAFMHAMNEMAMFYFKPIIFVLYIFEGSENP